MFNEKKTMPYEFKKPVKSVATEVQAIQEEELQVAVAEELKVADPENAKQVILENTITEENSNGTKKTRVHKKNSEESGAEV